MLIEETKTPKKMKKTKNNEVINSNFLFNTKS